MKSEKREGKQRKGTGRSEVKHKKKKNREEEEREREEKKKKKENAKQWPTRKQSSLFPNPFPPLSVIFWKKVSRSPRFFLDQITLTPFYVPK